MPIKYLGVPLETNPKMEVAWKLVVDKIRKKLAYWKASLLLVGWPSLNQSLIVLMPIQDCLRCQKRWLVKIISHQCQFFQASGEHRKGTPLVKWELI